MTLRLMKSNTFRDLVECQLFEVFPAYIKSIDESLKPYMIDYIDVQEVEFYYQELIDYVHGRHKFSLSTNHPNGLLFHGKGLDAIFGIGIFFNEKAPSKPHIHFVYPLGKDAAAAMKKVNEEIKKKFSEAEFYCKPYSATKHIESIFNYEAS